MHCETAGIIQLPRASARMDNQVMVELKKHLSMHYGTTGIIQLPRASARMDNQVMVELKKHLSMHYGTTGIIQLPRASARGIKCIRFKALAKRKGGRNVKS